jgi:hypothetical protein
LFIILLLVKGLSGCASAPSKATEILDPQTAVTLTSAATPLIFYRDNSGAAAYARDYVYVGPIGVNNMGSYRYFLWFGIWSANPAVPPASHRNGFDLVTIFADGEPLQLEVAGWTPGAIGASLNPYVKPVASAADAYFEVTIDQVRLIAESRDLRIVTTGMGAASFELWDAQTAAFRSLDQFLGRAGY